MNEGDVAMLTTSDLQNQGRTGEEREQHLRAADATLLARAAEIAEQAACGLVESGWDDDWVQVLAALAGLVAEQARQGDPCPAVSAEKLRTLLAETNKQQAPYWLADDTGKKKLANACKALEQQYERYRKNLAGRATAARVPAIVQPRWEKRGRDNAYWLELLPVELPDARTAVSCAEEKGAAGEPGAIDYIEELEVPLPLVKRPLRVSVHGWRGLVLVAPIMVTILAMGGLIWLFLMIAVSSMPAREIFQWSVILALLAAMLGWFAWPLFRLIEDGIIMAPDALQLGLPLGHVIVVRDEDGKRVIRMVRYVGESCPICRAKVTIRSGRGPFRGRLLGACSRNPVEHLFSFDHVTRRGRLLR